MADQIRYDLLTQQALRGVVRNVLTETAKKGLPGDHHFYISFDTRADGVRLSDRLRAQYPDEMGRVAVETAVKVLKGEQVQPDVTVRIGLVTKENANP